MEVQITEVPDPTASARACQLVAAAVNDLAPRVARAMRKAVETVGRCEWCGVVDHHLIDGECERCRTASETFRAGEPAVEPIAVAGAAAAQCVFCECTDDAACWDDAKGAPCHWLFVDRDRGVGVCSACRAEQLRYGPLIRYLRERGPLRARIAANQARPAA